jgi:hypothetical protein
VATRKPVAATPTPVPEPTPEPPKKKKKPSASTSAMPDPGITAGEANEIAKAKASIATSAGVLIAEARREGIHPDSLFFRRVCGVLYAVDSNLRAFHEIVKDEPFNQVPMVTLALWAEQDRWVALRESVVEKWQSLLIDKVGNALVSTRVDALSQVQTLKHRIVKKLEIADHPYEPNMSATYDDAKYKPCVKCGRHPLYHDDPLEAVPAEKLLTLFGKLTEIEMQIGSIVLPLLIDAKTNDDERLGIGATKDDGTQAIMQVLDKASPDDTRKAAHALLRQNLIKEVPQKMADAEQKLGEELADDDELE